MLSVRLIPPPAISPAPSIAEPAPSSAAVEASLRSLTVRRSTWASFHKGEPSPLLSPEQTLRIRDLFIEQLPKLRTGAALWISFRDTQSITEYELELRYAKGELEYRFLRFALNPILPQEGDLALAARVSRAELIPQNGQRMRRERQQIVLRERLVFSAEAQQVHLEDKLRRLRALERESVLSVKEVETWARWIEDHPAVSLEVWTLHTERIRTLYFAMQQGLISPEEHEYRLRALKEQLLP